MERFYSWAIIDRFPDNDLIDINPISLRAYSHVSRNKFQIEGLPISIEILCVLESMEALDYHYDNFIGFKKFENKSKRVHEIVAYLNGVGQIYYSINSDFLKKSCFHLKILKYAVFRLSKRGKKNNSRIYSGQRD